MSQRSSPTVVGAFVVGGLVLLIGGLVALGSGRFFVKAHTFVCYFDDVNGLSIGSPVKFKGVEIGAVSRILLHLDQSPSDFHIPVLIELDAQRLLKAGAEATLDPESMKQRIESGLRAQLVSQSLVTGLLFVQLDYFPGSVARFVGGGEHFQEIPTLPTPLEEAQATLKQFVVRLNQLNLSDLVDRATGAFDAAQRLVSAPEVKTAIVSLNQALSSFHTLTVAVTEKVDPLSHGVVAATDKTAAAANEVEQATKTLHTLIEPGSPVEVKLTQALDDVSAAARSLRILADSLDREPSSIVRGKDYGPGKP
jgi:paraquat-inducible protein B